MTYSTEEQKQIAETILDQLGGHIKPMVGAYNVFSHAEGALSFRFKCRAQNQSNYCKISLIGDSYKVEFKSIRGASIKDKGEFEDVYADTLRSLFESETGLCLVMPVVHFARA
jgi:hypothetical protein